MAGWDYRDFYIFYRSFMVVFGLLMGGCDGINRKDSQEVTFNNSLILIVLGCLSFIVLLGILSSIIN